jgi:hypothetical protein
MFSDYPIVHTKNVAIKAARTECAHDHAKVTAASIEGDAVSIEVDKLT